MLTVVIQIGFDYGTIAKIEILNMGKTNNDNQVRNYNYRVIKEDEAVIKGKVIHNRLDGAERLVIKVLEDYLAKRAGKHERKEEK